MKNKLRSVTPTSIAAVFLTVCIVVGLCFCVVLRNKFPSVGIEKIETVDDLENLDIKMQYIMTESQANRVTADTTYLDGETYVLVVRPTGKFRQYRGSFSQEVEVLDVRAGGNDLKAGEVVQIFRSFGVQCGGGLTFNGIEEGVIGYTLHENVMYPENRYLIFVEQSELNEYLTQKEFYVNKGLPAVINMDLAVPHAAPENFNECRDIDIFCTTDAAAEKVYYVQRELMAKYGL